MNLSFNNQSLSNVLKSYRSLSIICLICCGSGWSWSRSNTTYKHQLWVRIPIFPSRKTASDLRNKSGFVLRKKTGSEQNKTGTGSDSQNMNIKYKYIKFYLFHSARGSNPWPFEFCNSSLNQWAEKNRFIQVKNLIARSRFLAIFSSIWKNKIWSNKAFYNYSV